MRNPSILVLVSDRMWNLTYLLIATEGGIRGLVSVQLSDHTGTSVADFPGLYSVDFQRQ